MFSSCSTQHKTLIKNNIKTILGQCHRNVKTKVAGQESFNLPVLTYDILNGNDFRKGQSAVGSCLNEPFKYISILVVFGL